MTTPRAAAQAPFNSEVATDQNKIRLTVVGGPHPYLWIGDPTTGSYVDSVDMAPILAALKPKRRRRARA